MLTQKKVIDIISKAVRKKVNNKSSANNIDSWDSLAQLNILASLDKISKGKSSKIPNLVEVNSVKNIIQILKKKKIITK